MNFRYLTDGKRRYLSALDFVVCPAKRLAFNRS